MLGGIYFFNLSFCSSILPFFDSRLWPVSQESDFIKRPIVTVMLLIAIRKLTSVRHNGKGERFDAGMKVFSCLCLRMLSIESLREEVLERFATAKAVEMAVLKCFIASLSIFLYTGFLSMRNPASCSSLLCIWLSLITIASRLLATSNAVSI